MILALIVIIAAWLTNLGGGLAAGVLALPALEALGQLTYGLLDATLP